LTISILILTFNEDKNLPSCLEAISWCDDIVVLDSFSTDGTVEIAEKFGVRVYQRQFDNFAGQRNFALTNFEFRHGWIFHLDADEIITEDLKSEMEREIENAKVDAFRVPSKMIMFGKWLRFSGMYPAYQVRLGRVVVLRFKQVGHGQREDIDASRVGTLKNPYLHYSFSKGFEDWFTKHNRYSTQEALEGLKILREKSPDWRGLLSISEPTRRRRVLKDISVRLPFRPLLRFLYIYILRCGFLDGKAGLTYCLLISIYEYMIVMKMKELRLSSNSGINNNP
jgi:glycosyltransferase involved in cell wall biosynthesis